MKSTQNKLIQICDMADKIISEINPTNNLEQISMSNFANGLYLVKLIEDDQLISVQKFMKE
jgi:hypothetical protein